MSGASLSMPPFLLQNTSIQKQLPPRELFLLWGGLCLRKKKTLFFSTQVTRLLGCRKSDSVSLQPLHSGDRSDLAATASRPMEPELVSCRFAAKRQIGIRPLSTVKHLNTKKAPFPGAVFIMGRIMLKEEKKHCFFRRK